MREHTPHFVNGPKQKECDKPQQFVGLHLEMLHTAGKGEVYLWSAVRNNAEGNAGC